MAAKAGNLIRTLPGCYTAHQMITRSSASYKPQQIDGVKAFHGATS
jgi:hypothetical protein